MKYLQEKQPLYKSWSLTKTFTECVENKKILGSKLSSSTQEDIKQY